jgi:hypothetical protein
VRRRLRSESAWDGVGEEKRRTCETEEEDVSLVAYRTVYFSLHVTCVDCLLGIPAAQITVAKPPQNCLETVNNSCGPSEKHPVLFNCF